MQTVEDFKKVDFNNPQQIGTAYRQLLEYTQQLESENNLLRHRKYGRSSERFVDPNQGGLFNEVEATAPDDDEMEAAAAEEDLKPGSENKKGGNKGSSRRRKIEIPENIERQTHVHDLPEDEKVCACCGKQMCRIGEEVTEKVDLIPARLVARQDVYPKYACPDHNCDGKPKQALRPDNPLGKMMATATILAFIATQKYHFGVPLYRLEGFFKNLGVTISRCTMSLWMIKAAEALRPIYQALEEKLLSEDYIHIDETGLQVLGEPGKPATSKSQMWVRRSGRGPPIVLYHYSESRSADVAKQLLRGFTGYLQSDDYSGYTSVAKASPNIEHLLCWDHSRRYFWHAYQALPRDKKKNSVAERALKIIKKLYKVEVKIKNQSDERRLKARAEESMVILEKLKKLTDQHRPSLGDNTPTAKAIDYMNDNWEKLQIYLTKPFLNISNSPAEQAVRPFALGRKAWLFSQSPRGADASAILYSLAVTAKENGRNPNQYFIEALQGIAKAKNPEDLQKLLPLSTMG